MLELVDLLKKIFVKNPKKRISILEIREHPWMNLDFSEKIPLIPAKPLLDDAEDIGKAIRSIHNDHEFTVYTLKSHSISKKSYPNVSDSSVKISIQPSNNSSLRIEVNQSFNALDDQPPQSREMMRGGRRASLQDVIKDSRSFTRSSIIDSNLVLHQNSLVGKSKIEMQDRQKLPLLKPSSSSSFQFSNEPNRRRGSIISETSSNHNSVNFDVKQKGSSPLTKAIVDDEDQDISEAADLAVQNVMRNRRMSIGPDKRATIKEEDPIPQLTSNSFLKENSSIAAQPHEEISLGYSYARRPSYRRASITEVSHPPSIAPDPSPQTNLGVAKETPPINRRASFSTARRNSHSFTGVITSSFNSPTIQPVTILHQVVNDEANGQEYIHKRSVTLDGASVSKSNREYVEEDARFEMWDDPKISNETSLSSAPAVTIEMINDWHNLHRPAKNMRTMRYSFNKNTTSLVLEPARIFQAIHQVLLDIADAGQNWFTLTFRRSSDLYLLECNVEYHQKETILKFDIEVCKVWLLKMHGIRMKRLQGDIFDYKQLHTDLIERLGANGFS